MNWVSAVFGLHKGWGDTQNFIQIVKQRLNDTFVQNWMSRLNESSRALFYRGIARFDHQPYLDIITVRKFRVGLTKLRVSSHRLEVEAGRWHKPTSTPFDMRKCPICNVLEDEFHFLIECPLYTELRFTYIRSYYLRRTNMYKVVELLSSDNKRTMRNLGIFVTKAFEKRNEILSQL